VAAGHDRYAMHGKRIVFDGRDVSRDPSRSWVSPSCSPDGATLVAAASRNTTPPRIGREHRAIWQLRPARKPLTSPPAGFTDEFPRLLQDGSVLFVRTKHGRGTVELLRRGKLTPLGSAGPAANYYGHYDWPDIVSVP
jgi:Tol biopolymer transport system component